MNNLEKKVDALVRLVLCGSEAEANDIRWELKDLVAGAPIMDPVSKIRSALLEVGVPDSLIGHSYLMTALELVVMEPSLANAITTKLYPRIAAMHLTTPSRTERAIRHAIEVAFDRGDLDVLRQYFGNTISLTKVKPTNGEFIARMANAIREM